MAWSYGNRKWYLPFTSLNGTSCYINIYKRGYTGNTYTTLTGAANPIEWEEDNDESLLQVVRTKTGYINVVESSYGDLNDLYPNTDTEHFIEFYYGSTLYFTGYMQAQAFDADWAPGPRVINFPIQSPLAVTKGLHFNIPTNPGFVSIGNLLYQSCDLISANISHIIFPNGISINNTAFTPLWRMSTLVCCPFNKDFDRAPSGTNALYEPLTVYEFIEGLCNSLGLMCHDMPNYLVFSRYDYMDTYYNYDVSTIAELQPTGSPSKRGSWETDYSNARILSNNNREDEIVPISTLEINYDGDFFESEGIEYKHSRAAAPVGEGSTSCQLVPVGYEVESDRLITGIPSSTNPGVSMGAWGGGKNIKECFLIHTGSSWTSSTKVLKYRFLIPPKNGGFTISIPVSQGTDMDNPEGGTISFGVIIKNGSSYYDAGDEQRVWVNSETINTVSRFDETRPLKVEVIRGCPNANLPLEIIITTGEMASAGLVWLEDITVSQGSAPGSIYYNDAVNEGKNKKIIKVDNGSDVEGSVTMLFNTAIKNKTMVIPSSADAYWDGQLACSYDYMFQAQRRIVIDTFISHNPTAYTDLILFRLSGWHWRITSIGFCPWDDKMRVALVYSPTI